MSNNPIIGIIGCGNMGSALTENLVKSWRADSIFVFDKEPQKQSALVRHFGVRGVPALDELADSSDVIIIAVKPQDIDAVLGVLKGRRDKLVISIAAGMTLQYVSSRIGARVPAVRVMPNLNAVVGASMTAISCSSAVTEPQKETAARVFESVGSVVFIREELMNAFTAVAGSGPAFIAYLMDDMPPETVRKIFVEESLAFGFDPAAAEFIVDKTIAGTQKILKNFDRDIFIKRVCSKGGTTEAGMEAFQSRHKTPEGLSEAIRAACRRAGELAII
ncbi:MAG: pyrroline-5-carboxylate reductase [Candidatus Omnitrophota bacterium]|jgi:pyrroline-5-carboxylate reductase|nr:pyrroline-5-carboxylate reductase [Candidatus Omnitrophota bacterium]MDD5137233.1 pyrroline-5-carboxylate reductase [Candidatus Omnitrophota bacterium]MDD5537920.1 pyrroline-5-carboxylate reductase [Candidatus Omnitrophota bacterium]